MSWLIDAMTPQGLQQVQAPEEMVKREKLLMYLLKAAKAEANDAGDTETKDYIHGMIQDIKVKLGI